MDPAVHDSTKQIQLTPTGPRRPASDPETHALPSQAVSPGSEDENKMPVSEREILNPLPPAVDPKITPSYDGLHCIATPATPILEPDTPVKPKDNVGAIPKRQMPLSQVLQGSQVVFLYVPFTTSELYN